MQRPREDVLDEPGERQVVAERLRDGVAGTGAPTASVGPAAADRLGGEHAGLERLRDALTGHRVDDAGGVADEQHPRRG